MRDAVEEVRARIAELRSTVQARAIIAIDGAARLIASDGDPTELDTTALATRAGEQLTQVDRTLAKLLRQRGYNIYDERTDMNVHVRSVGRRLMLIVIYDANTSTGVVTLGARRTAEDLEPLVRSETRFREIPEDDPEDDPEGDA